MIVTCPTPAVCHITTELFSLQAWQLWFITVAAWHYCWCLNDRLMLTRLLLPFYAHTDDDFRTMEGKVLLDSRILRVSKKNMVNF